MTRIKKPISTHQTGMSVIGKIKVGMKKPGSNYPMSLDYFRFTSPTKDYEKRALEMYGKPNSLRVTFMSDNDENNCCQRMELRDNGGRLVAHTDLETIYVSKPEGFLPIPPSTVALKGGFQKCIELYEKSYKSKFIEVLYLRVVLLDFPVFGQWEIYTKGKASTIKNIIGNYDTTKGLAGRVKGIPFNLTVTKVKSNRDLGKTKNGQPIVRHYPVIGLHPDLGVEAQEQIMQLGSSLRGLITNNKIEKLTTGDTKAIEAPKAKVYTEYEEL